MTDEQLRQAAAKALSEKDSGCSAAYWFNAEPTSIAKEAVTQTIALHRLASMVVTAWDGRGLTSDIVSEARKHLLPAPTPSPVERLAEAIKESGILVSVEWVDGILRDYGLTLTERSEP